ncbi:hypothetical protein [Streptomyces celluloflavus]|uniref:hypothetical protein n=1 Tax=Streptomyces celluloflavus TaxID=58344 RepID=UPI0036B3D570
MSFSTTYRLPIIVRVLAITIVAFPNSTSFQHRYPNRAMAEAAAERAADEALLRAVESLFADRCRQLRITRGAQPARPAATSWASRCAELASQVLPEDLDERSKAQVRETVCGGVNVRIPAPSPGATRSSPAARAEGAAQAAAVV